MIYGETIKLNKSFLLHSDYIFHIDFYRFVDHYILTIMTQIRNMLVPGGLGFIGSHTVVHIIEQTSASVVIIDDLSNCFDDVLERIKIILSLKFSK